MKKDAAFHNKHSLGQNFLTDEGLLARLVELSGVGAGDCVLEIGPGAGGMTKELAKRVRSVLALEIDEDLFPILRVALLPYENVVLVKGDVMKVSLTELTQPLGPFHIVANLPYYLTTPLIEKLVKSDLPILSMSFMVQKEAAVRLLAEPKSKEYGPLSIKIRQGYEAENVLAVPARMFSPPPKVDSAFIVMKRRQAPLAPAQNERTFSAVVDAAFVLRRKTLANNLTNTFHISRVEALAWIARCGFKDTARGEELSLEDFARLADKAPEGVAVKQ